MNKTLAESVDLLLQEMPVSGPAQQLDLKDPTLLSKLHDTRYEIEGYNLRVVNVEDAAIYALCDNEEILSLVVAVKVDNFADTDKTGLVIKRSWTPSKHRGKGFSPALYFGLYRMGYIVISDQQVSPSALAVWEKLNKKKQLKYYDWTERKFTEQDPYEQEHISFVLMDHVDFFIRRTGGLTSILTDSKFFTGS